MKLRHNSLFTGVDHISSLNVPFNTTFALGRTLGRVASISAITLLPGSTKLLALSDLGFLLTANVSFDNTSLALKEVNWTGQWAIDTNVHLDTEGIAVLPDGEVIVANEDEPIFALPKWSRWPQLQRLQTTTRARLPKGISLAHWRGLESLAASDGGRALLTGTEDAVHEDAPNVHRVIEFNASTGEVLCQKAFRLPEHDPILSLTELVPLDQRPLAVGGKYLALVRGWSKETGSDIRLYLLDATNADAVNACKGVAATGTTCSLESLKLMSTELLLKWTKDTPLDGKVPVDNYEGMTVVPFSTFGRSSEADLGGVVLLMVNDNNDNPKQVGTQFVTLRLVFGSTSSGNVAASLASSSATITPRPRRFLGSHGSIEAGAPQRPQ